MRLRRINPPPKRIVPIWMLILGPYLSIAHPCIGPKSPLSMRPSEKAADNAVRLQPKAACSWSR